MASILVTGWTGFIWSHTVVDLLEHGHEVVIIDNLTNSKATVVDRLATITGKRPHLVVWDIRDEEVLQRLFVTYSIDAVIHFAAKKAVGESCGDPRGYYDNNIGWLITLTKTMHQHWCRTLVFSSSCTVYDPSLSIPPFDEKMITGNCFSPYGTTKLVAEMLLRDLHLYQWFSIVALRYFNPIGAHPSWLIGEDPAQPPTNLLPVIFQVLTGKRSHLAIYGDDYETPDGTCIRDYIHVWDVAHAHTMTVERQRAQSVPVLEYFNIGTWTGTSVKELVAITEQVTTRTIKTTIVPRRPGDVPVAFACPDFAEQLLGRRANHTIAEAIYDGRQYITRYHQQS